MLARLSDEVAKATEEVVTHAVIIRHSAIRDDLGDARIEVLDAVWCRSREAQIERQVIDTSAVVGNLLKRHADVAGELCCRALYAVAESDGLDAAGARDGPAIHRHRVDIVEQRRIRT